MTPFPITWRFPPPGTILSGDQLHLRAVPALHAGGKRLLVAGGQHAAPSFAAEGAVPAWHGEGKLTCERIVAFVLRQAERIQLSRMRFAFDGLICE